MSIARLSPAQRVRVADLQTAGGRTSRMVFVPAFNCQDIHTSLGTGVHPAFIVNGKQVAGFYVGMYQGVIDGTELISRAGVDVKVNSNFDDFSAAARACGAGWHLMTNAEWAAVTLMALKQARVERGNDQWGRAYNNTAETGRRQDHGVPGAVHGDYDGRIITGTGPDTWRHDNAGEGIADLVGNVWEWVGGMRLDAADIQILPDNDAATGDLAATSTAWLSLGYRYTHNLAWQAFNTVTLADSVGNPPAGDDLQLLRRLALAPLPEDLRSARGQVYNNETGERLPLRGGDWGYGSGAGWFTLHLSSARTALGRGVGGRPAFVAL